MMSNAIPDTQLGLNHEEIRILRQGQAAVEGGGSNSSRAASRASSQGILVLDSSSLSDLGRHFDQLMANVVRKIEVLSQQTQMFTQVQYERAENIIDKADREIARYKAVNEQIDELELEFDRIKHIKEIVKQYRARVERLDRQLSSSTSSDSTGRRQNAPGRHTSGRHQQASSHRHRD